MSNYKRVVLMLLLMFTAYAMSYQPVEALPFDYEETDQYLSDGEWYYFWDDFYSGDTINVYLETDETSMIVDFFICDSGNYADWVFDGSGSGFGVEFDVHTNYYSFSVPNYDTWYVVVSNRYAESYVYVDIAIDEDADNRPYYSSSSYDQVINDQVLENTQWYHVSNYLNPGNVISGHFSTYFTSDGVDFFICDDDTYDDWLSSEDTTGVYGLLEDMHTATISDFVIPYADTWHIVFSALDQYDTITFSYGLDIDDSTTTTTTTTSDTDTSTTSTGVDMAIGGILALVGILVVLAIVAFCCCRKKKDGRPQLKPVRGYPPPGIVGDPRSTDNIVLGALRSYPRVGMEELAGILKMPLEQVRRTTLKLIGTGAISGTFDRRTDEFTSKDATAIAGDMREDAIDVFSLPDCPYCGAPLTGPLVAGETMECANCGKLVTG